MSIALSLSTFALRQVVDGACAAVGMKGGGEAVVGFLVERFTDHSQRLSKALHSANERAWTALEIALAGDSLWERCKSTVASAEDKEFAQQIRAFFDATQLPELTGKAAFRQKCLEELRAARKGKALTAGTLDPRQLAQRTAHFARFSDPTRLLDAEWQAVIGFATQVKEAGFPDLAWLLSQRPRHGLPILIVAVRYFFRRAVEEDQKLFQGLSFAKLEALGEAQEKGFASLSAALAQQGQRLEELLRGVQAVVVQTHSAVLDLQGQMKGQGEQIEQIGQAVMKLLEQHQLQRREVRPGDSLSIRNEGERQLVKQLVARYRSLPEGQRQNVPSLLNAIGKLEVVAGNIDQAQQDFQQVATMVDDTKAKAEAHFNAYQTALERREFDTALKEFIEAVKLDAKRYAPFPVGKYHPLRILGAGGFGTAFLCRHKYMNAEVVVKALHLEALGRDTDKVFTEAQVLRQLDHPAIIRISECGYVDASGKGRPHIIMDYFQGQTLESYVKEHGPMPVEDMLAVARQVAEGLQAAHGAKILHRDVKPANLLVRKEATGWKVKIIDFGLAMPQKVVQTSQKASTARQKETMIGSSIAGTLDYGAPEQMGKRKEPVGPYSDVYGWAKTCCYALFQTTQPLMKHWKSVPEPLAELLEACLDEDPKKRPSGFAEVLTGLTLRESSHAPAAPAPMRPEHGFDFERHAGEAVAAPRARTTRKKHEKSVLPFVLGGVGLLAVALIVLFAVLLGGQKKEGPKVVEREKNASPAKEDQPKDKASPDKEEHQPKDKPKDVPQEEPIGEVRRFNGHTGGIWSVDFSSDGRLAISGSGKEWKDGKFTNVADNTVRVWDVKTGKQLQCFTGHAGYVRNVAFSPDSRQAASCGGSDGTVRQWDVEKGKELHQFPGHKIVLDRAGNKAGATGVAFIPGSADLASVGADGALRVWDTARGKMSHEYHLGLGEIHCIAISPDGCSAFCGMADNLACLVDLATGQVQRRYEGQSSLLHGIAVSPDGRLLLSGGARGNAVMWSVNDGKKVAEFEGHAVRFSKDGKRILLGCNDSTVRLLATADRRELQRFPGHKAIVQGVAFSPDGRNALSGSWDGTFRLWRLPPQVVAPVEKIQPSPTTPAESPTAKAMKAIQGEWLCVGMEEIGIVYDKWTIAQQDRRVKIKGVSYTMIRTKDGKRASHVGTFTIDVSNGHFDYIGTGEEWVGIYELDGDTLKVCYRYKRNADCVRPTEFKTDTARPNISVFYVFKRVKK